MAEGRIETAPPSFKPMRITSLAVALSLLLTMMGFAATATKSKAVVKKAAPVKKAATKPVSKAATKQGSKKVVRSHAPVTTWRNRQMSPTSDRYKEIQQALIDKGYLISEPTGVWDNKTQDAMTRFQNEQKQPPTDKNTAATQIGLG